MLILIPSYEPTENLLSLINEINLRAIATILIIDDGSGPKYKALFNEAESMGCVVLHHEFNQGKGEALKTGFRYLQSTGYKGQIVCADSDGQHKAHDIIRIGKFQADSDDSLILGSRVFKDRIPLRSKIGNRFTALMFRLSTGINIPDTQTGLRAFSYTMPPWLLSIEGSRFEYEFNVLLRAKQDHITLFPVPIATVYHGNNKHSHFRPIVDSTRIYLPFLKFALSSMSAGLLDFALFFIMLKLTGSLLASVVTARIISALYNFSVNALLVFREEHKTSFKEMVKHQAPKYFSLVGMIMFSNYLLLTLLTGHVGMASFPAKLITEIMLFTASFIFQKTLIFRKTVHMTH